VTGFCEHGNEPPVFIKGREFLGRLCCTELLRILVL
jgi:hypothetical protein